MAGPGARERQWYVMLFPAEAERRAILDRLRPLAEQTGGALPLAPAFTWREQRPHMLVLRHLPAPPSDTLRRLDHPHPGITFTASRLVVTERQGDTFLNRLEQPLRGQ